jgi:hypothetical protein
VNHVKKWLYKTADLAPAMKCEQSVFVEYYTLKNEYTDEGFDEKKPYGIEVVKKQIIDGRSYREIKRVEGIGCDTEQIERLLDILHLNTVTPITVGDVLEDLAVK